MAGRMVHVRGNTFYIDGAVKIGVIRNPTRPEKSAVVDTGIDDDSGKRVIRLMQEENMQPGFIINTHSHADHCGGNSYIADKCGAAVLAPEFDKSVVECPELEPFYLYSASPLSDLNTKFLKAKPSRVAAVLEAGSLDLEGVAVDILPLKGHTPGAIGVATEDGALFTGDAFFSCELIEKHGLPYFSDIKNALLTLEYLKGLKYDYYIPCHGAMLADPVMTLDCNIRRINEIVGFITDACVQALDREDIVSSLMEKYQIKQNPIQYYLAVSTVSAFLSYMTNIGALEIVFEKYKLKWLRK